LLNIPKLAVVDGVGFIERYALAIDDRFPYSLWLAIDADLTA
jgi:hypothetical protein